MKTVSIASLDSKALALRLHDLVGEERNVQVDFLLHLDEFDRRRAYLEGSYASVWDYCLKALHLGEGAAWRRIAAMRVLRKVPRTETALRDGRLCLTTLALLGQVLTDENADDLLARAAHRSKAEVDSLVASVKPRTAPVDGVRKLSEPRPVPRIEPAAPPVGAGPPVAFAPGVSAVPCEEVDADTPPNSGPAGPVVTPPVASPPRRDGHAEMHAVERDRWSLRVTIDHDLKEDLETLTALLSHKVPRGDLASVLREAIRCGIEKHGKRRGAVEPERKRPAKPEVNRAHRDTRAIPLAVRREVWRRDGGRCTWTGPDGRRCGSRWQLELDHITPPLFGGGATADNLRLRCKPHDLLYAEQVYGREHMDRFRRHAPNG